MDDRLGQLRSNAGGRGHAFSDTNNDMKILAAGLNKDYDRDGIMDRDKRRASWDARN